MEWKSLKECYRACLPLNLPAEAGLIYRSSNNMCPQFPGSPFFSTSGFDCDYSSHDVVVVGDGGSRQYVLVGALTANRSLSFFTVRRRSGRMESILVEQPEIKPGEKPEEIMVATGSDWRELLKQYAVASAAAMGVKPIQPKENLVGYCTWYYYYADVSEGNFLENVNALAAHPGLPYGHAVAQIDDGYQTFQGDWLDQHESWPTPLKTIAKQATDKGLIPGIWLMPMLASTASRVFREHPDWFVKNEQGEPFAFAGWSPAPDNYWACLDATLPAVQAHLTHVFKTFWDWGFRYFKMDGLGYGLPEGKRHDPNATAVSAFRLALKTIREAVPEAHILGCCPPFMACMGYVDSARVSCDTAATWTGPHPGSGELSKPYHGPDRDNCDHNPGACCIKDAWHDTIANWWMYDRWFRADPDVLIARQDRARHSLGEARISVLSGIMTGVTITSDNLGTIAPDRLKLLELAAKTRLKDATPRIWYPYHWAQVWEGTIDGKHAVAFVNDTDVAQTFSLPKDAGMADGGVEILQGAGKLQGDVTVEPHDAMLIVEG